MKTVDCVVFILIKNGKFLVEKRPVNEDIDPAAMAIPGGHVESGETLETAFFRECMEELNVQPSAYRLIYKGLYRTNLERQGCYYYAVSKWKGRLRRKEAGQLKWLSFDNKDKLDLLIDRKAVSKLGGIAGGNTYVICR